MFEWIDDHFGTFLLMALALIALLLFGWFTLTTSGKMVWRDLVSDTQGVPRDVILYSADGSVIGTWSTNYFDTQDGITSFIDENGKKWLISGTFTAEEK